MIYASILISDFVKIGNSISLQVTLGCENFIKKSFNTKVDQ